LLLAQFAILINKIRPNCDHLLDTDIYANLKPFSRKQRAEQQTLYLPIIYIWESRRHRDNRKTKLSDSLQISTISDLWVGVTQKIKGFPAFPSS